MGNTYRFYFVSPFVVFWSSKSALQKLKTVRVPTNSYLDSLARPNDLRGFLRLFGRVCRQLPTHANGFLDFRTEKISQRTRTTHIRETN